MTSGINERKYHYQVVKSNEIKKYLSYRQLCEDLGITRNKMNYIIRNPLPKGEYIIERIRETVPVLRPQ